MSNNSCHNWFHLGDKHAGWRKYYFDLSLVGSQEWRVRLRFICINPTYSLTLLDRSRKSEFWECVVAILRVLHLIHFMCICGWLFTKNSPTNFWSYWILLVFTLSGGYSLYIMQPVAYDHHFQNSPEIKTYCFTFIHFLDKSWVVTPSVHQHLCRSWGFQRWTISTIPTNTQRSCQNILPTFRVSPLCCFFLPCSIRSPSFPDHFQRWHSTSWASFAVDSISFSWNSYTGKFPWIHINKDTELLLIIFRCNSISRFVIW